MEQTKYLSKEEIDRRKEIWYEHNLRIDENRLTNILLNYNPENREVQEETRQHGKMNSTEDGTGQKT
jgi:hypothetical protein